MKINKLIAMAVALSVSFCAMAEGYQVNSLSAKQNGMGHTGTALKLGAESMFFNPAGMGFMKESVDATASFTAIISQVYATHNGTEYATDSDPSTPINAMFAFSVYDNLKFGVGFYTPYGSGINWGESWPGALLSQSVKLQVMCVQPTVAWRPLKNLAVGAGLTINWGSVNLNKGLIPGSSLDAAVTSMGMPQFANFGNNIAASVNLEGNASPRLGVNLGVMWDVTDRFTVGFDYRSNFEMRVKAGTATLTTSPAFDQLTSGLAQMAQGNPALLQNPKVATLLALNQIDKASFAAAMPAVAVYRLGFAYRPIDKLVLALDAQLSGWNEYKALDIEFAGPVASNFNQHIEKNYKNSWLFGLGAEYGLTERFDVRCGVLFDTTPCNSEYYNPETPGMTKIEPSVGLSFRPVKGLSVNAAFLYVAGLGANDRSCMVKDPIIGDVPFKADYKLHALCPSIGLSYSF